jgi:hypothetical protein
MSGVDLGPVERTMAALLGQQSREIQYHDRSTGETLVVSADVAASPSGLLPALLVAGEAVWREATGKGFDLDIARDSDALLGYRLRGIRSGNFATVMLATMEATEQAAWRGPLVVNEINAIWSAATARHEVVPRPSSSGTGPSP